MSDQLFPPLVAAVGSKGAFRPLVSSTLAVTWVQGVILVS